MEHVADGVGRPDSYEQTVGGLVKAICEKPFVEEIQSLFDDLGERIQLSSVAADACLLMFWKRIVDDFSKCAFGEARKWCQAALHKLFSAGQVDNRSKIFRKMILCALELRDAGSMKHWSHYVPVQAEMDPLSLYTLYKLALSDKDVDLDSIPLHDFTKTGEEGLCYFYVCASEAENSVRRCQVIARFQQIFDALLTGPSDSTMLFGISRCLIRLVYLELTDDHYDAPLQQLCSILDSVLVRAKEIISNSDQGGNVPINELEWFSRSALRLAIESSGMNQPDMILQLCGLCREFLNIYSNDLGSEARVQVLERRNDCEFLDIATRMHKARDEEKGQSYKDIRRQIQSFRARVPLTNTVLDVISAERDQTLILFDFEAAISLQQWADLNPIIEAIGTSANENSWALLIDMVLCASGPMPNILQLLLVIGRAIRASLLLPEDSKRQLLFSISAMNASIQGRSCNPMPSSLDALD